MPLDFDTLARVYNQVIADGKTVKVSMESIKSHGHKLTGKVEEYQAGVDRVQKMVAEGARWPSAIEAVASGAPDLKVVKVKKAKKGKKG